MDSKLNPTNTGTWPDLVSHDNNMPGSTWLKGYPWMQELIDKVKSNGIIKSVEDIRLNNDAKKVVKEGIVFDTFASPEENGAFAE